MKEIVFEKYGQPDVLQLKEVKKVMEGLHSGWTANGAK